MTERDDAMTDNWKLTDTTRDLFPSDPAFVCPECEGTGVVSNCNVTVNCNGSHVMCESRECPECDGEGQ